MQTRTFNKSVAGLFLFSTLGLTGCVQDGPSLNTVPKGVTAEGGPGSLIVAWSSMTGASSYNLYCSDSTPVTTAVVPVTNVTSPYTVSGLTKGSKHYCSVTAVLNGKETGLSSEVSATVLVPQPPALTLSGGVNQVTAAWTTVAGATSYNLRCSRTTPVTSATTTVTGVRSPYVYGGLANGETYHCAVTAVIAGDETDLSAEQSATTQIFPVTLSGALGIGVSTHFSAISGVAADAAGNMYVHGYTDGNMVAGSGSSLGYQDAYLIKYNSNGVKQWTRQYGVSGQGVTSGFVKVGLNGKIYINGYTDGNLQTGTGTSIGGSDGYVAQYDASGTRLWLHEFGAASSSTQFAGLALDASGNLYTVGDTNGDIGQGTPVATDFVLLKINAAGSTQFFGHMGASGHIIRGKGVAVTDDGAAIFVTGLTDGNAVTGSGSPTGTDDVYYARFDNTGTRVWIQQEGVAGKELEAEAIAVTSDGSALYAAGETTTNYSALSGSSTGAYDVFVAKLDPLTGTRTATYQRGSATKFSISSDIAISPIDGTVVFTGYTGGNLVAGAGSSTGTNDAFAIKLSTSLSPTWVRNIGSATYETKGVAVGFDTIGNSIYGGYTEANLNGAGAGPSPGHNSGFVVEYHSDGTRF